MPLIDPADELYSRAFGAGTTQPAEAMPTPAQTARPDLADDLYSRAFGPASTPRAPVWESLAPAVNQWESLAPAVNQWAALPGHDDPARLDQAHAELRKYLGEEAPPPSLLTLPQAQERLRRAQMDHATMGSPLTARWAVERAARNQVPYGLPSLAKAEKSYGDYLASFLSKPIVDVPGVTPKHDTKDPLFVAAAGPSALMGHLAAEELPATKRVLQALPGDATSGLIDIARGGIDFTQMLTDNMDQLGFPLLTFMQGIRKSLHAAGFTMAEDAQKEASAALGRLAEDVREPIAADAGLGERVVRSAATSLGGTVPMLLLAGPLAGFMRAGSSAGTLFSTGMGMSVAGQSYRRNLEKTGDRNRAALHGILDGGFEFIFEKMGGDVVLLDKAAWAKGFLGGVARFIAREVPSEVATTFAQNYDDWVFLHPEKSVEDFLAEQPGAALETALVSLLAGGGQVVFMKSLEAAANRINGSAQADVEQQALIDLFTASREADVFQSDPKAFGEFMQTVAPGHEVRIDAGLLEQALVDAGKTKADVPSLLEQGTLPGEISVPMHELIEALAGTPSENTVIQNIRTDPEAATIAERREMGNKALEEFKAVGARTLEKRRADERFQGAYEAYKEEIAADLEATGTYKPGATSAFSEVVATMQSVLADRLGVTPLQLRDGWVDKNGNAHKGYNLLAAGPKGPVRRPRQAATVADFTPGRIGNILRRSNWAIVTAENPNNKEASPEENAARNEMLRAELLARGLRFKEATGAEITHEQVEGKYVAEGQEDTAPKEHPFLVVGIDTKTALEIAKKFEQESVLTPHGLIYQDGAVHRATNVTEHNEEPANYWTRIPSTGALFTINLDFSERVPLGDENATSARPTGIVRGQQQRGANEKLEGAPAIQGAEGPDPRLVEVAEQYARDNGIPYARQAEYVAVDPERAARIAAAYDAMEHAPNDPAVKEAYANLVAQTVAQYQALVAAGYRFYFTRPEDPYNGNPWTAMRDLRANQTMGVFPTMAGFGSGVTDVDVAENPLLADTGLTWPNGSLDGEQAPVLANDLFRAVHDAFGHGLEGAGFRAQGEENAWQAHIRLFTGSAIAAITTETRGQNSWLDYGPFGEANQTARVEDTVFADQKTGLLPEWAWTEGIAPSEAPFSATGAGDFRGMAKEAAAKEDYDKGAAFARRVIAGETTVEDFEYFDGYVGTIDAEATLLPAEAKRVLFIGSGPVPLSPILFARKGYEVTGLDISEEAKELGEKVAAASGAPLSVIVGDATSFDFSGYDAVVLALEAGANDALKAAILRQANATLPEDGMLLLRSSKTPEFVSVRDSMEGLFTPVGSVDTWGGLGETVSVRPNTESGQAALLWATRGAGAKAPRTSESVTEEIKKLMSKIATTEPGPAKAKMNDKMRTLLAERTRRMDAEYEIARQGTLFQPAPTEGLTVVGIHFSQRERGALAPSAYGSGIDGAERARVMRSTDARLKHRAHFYLNTGLGIFPEAGVGSKAHIVTLKNMYDMTVDPLGLFRGAGGSEQAQDRAESAVLDAGFDGYFSRDFGRQGAAVVFRPSMLIPEAIGTQEEMEPRVAVIPPPAWSSMQKLKHTLLAARNLPAYGPPAMWEKAIAAAYPEEHKILKEQGVYERAQGALYKDELLRLVEPMPGELYQADTLVVDGVARPTTNSNGQRIAQTREGLENFWRWFGDSKAVDEQGRPLVVYHGTNKDFSVFGNPYAGKTWEMFSDTPGYSNRFAMDRGGVVYPDYVALKNPLDLSELPAMRGDARNKLLRVLADAGVVADPKTLPYERDLYQIVNRAGHSTSFKLQVELAGYDGIIMPDAHEGVAPGDETIFATTFIAFDSEQIASATGSTWMRGDVGANVLKQVPFYSPLLRAFQAVKQTVMPADQWAAWLKANQSKLGLKTDEIFWTGLDNYLLLRGKGRTTKDEIVGFLEDKQVRVETVLKGERKSRRTMAEVNGRFEVRRPDGSLYGRFNDELDAMAEVTRGGFESDTKFTSHWSDKFPAVEPGSHREEMVVLPTTAEKPMTYPEWVAGGMVGEWSTKGAATPEKPKFKSPGAHTYGDGKSDVNRVVHTRTAVVTSADGKRYLLAAEIQSDWGQEGEEKGFSGDREAILAAREKTETGSAEYARLTDMLSSPIPSGPFVTDTKAWVALGVKRLIAQAIDQGLDGVVFTTGGQNADIYDLRKQVESLTYSVKDEWLTAYPKDSGRENLSQAVAREDLPATVGKEVAEKIEKAIAAAEYDRQQWSVEEDSDPDTGEEFFTVVDPNGDPAYAYGGDLERFDTVEDANAWIDENAGTPEEVSLSGLDLEVGGEGMLAFYGDENGKKLNGETAIVPSVAGEIVRRLGGKKLEKFEFSAPFAYTVEDDDGNPIKSFQLREEAESFLREGYGSTLSYNAARLKGDNTGTKEATTQLGFDITPTMRDKIAELEGLPLFQDRQDALGTFNPERLEYTLLAKADLSTFMHEIGHFYLTVHMDLALEMQTRAANGETLTEGEQGILDDMNAVLEWMGGSMPAAAEGSDLLNQGPADYQNVREQVDLGRPVRNPGGAKLRALADRTVDKSLRGIFDKDGNLYVWDAYKATHQRGAEYFGVPYDYTNRVNIRIEEDGVRIDAGKELSGVLLSKYGTDPQTYFTVAGHGVLSGPEFAAVGGVLAQGLPPAQPAAPRQLTLAAWARMSLAEQTPYHEKFAETWEQYLFTGKAPTKKLESLFRRISGWMRRVYLTMKNFVLQRRLAAINPEISAVMDRMVAAEREIVAAQERRQQEALFKDAVAAGMTPEQYAKYLTLSDDTKAEAEEQLRARALRDMKWMQNRRNKTIAALQTEAVEKRKEVRAQVTAEVAEEPVFKAQKWLRHGVFTTDAGEEIQALKGHKLHIPALEAMFPAGALEGATDWRKLGYGKYGMLAAEGIHPDMVAEMFGYRSGMALVDALLNAPNFKMEVEGRTDQRMLEKYGDLATPEGIAKAADEAIMNDVRLKVLATELSRLNKAMGSVSAITRAANAYAAALIGSRVVKSLKPAGYAADAARAGKAAIAAFGKGDANLAAEQKRLEVLHHAAAKEAYAAEKEIQKIVARLTKIAKVKNEDGGAKKRNMDVVNAVRVTLASFGFGTAVQGENARKYLEALKQQEPEIAVAMEDLVLTATAHSKHWRNLKVDELRELNELVENVWSVAKRAKEIEIDGKRISRQTIVDELRAAVDLHEPNLGKPGLGTKHAVTPEEQRKLMFSTAKALFRRVSDWCEAVDGGKTLGPFRRYIWFPIKDAADQYRVAKVEALKTYRELLKTVAGDFGGAQIDARELDYVFGKDPGVPAMSELLHALLHTGNDSNKHKLLLGRGWATENEDGTLDTTRWDRFLDRMHNTGVLNKAHYDFVQGVWDMLEGTKGAAQKAHRAVFGRSFDEVTANAFSTPYGLYAGGYVPAMVDSRIESDAALRELANAENESMVNAFPAPARGFTMARVDYNRKLLLDLRSLAGHVDKVLLFSYLAEPVADVRRVLMSSELSGEINRIDPAAIASMFTPWLNRAAKQVVEVKKPGAGNLGRFWSGARARAGMAAMFANVVNTAQQFTGLFVASVKVSPGYLLEANAQYLLHPKDTFAFVTENSAYMKERLTQGTSSMTGDVTDILVNPSKYETVKAWGSKHAYFLQTAVDQALGPIIWTGAYKQAVSLGETHEAARKLADDTVRQTQGSQLPEEIANYEVGSPFYRMFTQFSGYFNAQANMLGTEFSKVGRELGLKDGMGRGFFLFLLGILAPAMVSELIVQAFRGGPDDEDKDGEYLDDWLSALTFGTARYVTAMAPGAGPAAIAVWNTWNHKPYDDRMSTAPAIAMMETTARAPASIYRAVAEDENGKPGRAIMDSATAVSMLLGVPARSVAKPFAYTADMEAGYLEPVDGLDYARGLITGTASPESKQ